MSTSEKIIAYIQQHRQASGKELSDYIVDITPRAIRKQLKNLLDKGMVIKRGRPPKVYYLLSTDDQLPNKYAVDKKTQRIINERYLYISPTGESIQGWEGFVTWCNKTKQDPTKTAIEYIQTLEKFDTLKKSGLIDGMPKMQHTFDNVYLDKLFYLDFYSIERFGKTKLGQMLLYAKQSQNKQLIRQLITTIRPQMVAIIKKYNISGVVFIPPTVKREIQFMKELERELALPVYTLSVTKIKTEITVPQKTLSKLNDRIENARHTIIIEEIKQFKNILLIDDAVGSGATLNETAKQIKDKNIVGGELIGLAITGSFKGFDIISEV